MHINHQHEFVYLAVPATKSTSTRNWLTEEYEAEQVGQAHDCDVPAECRDYFVFTVIRHPLERAVATWRRFNDGYNGPFWKRVLEDKFPNDFESFCELLADPDRSWVPSGRGYVLDSQSDLLDPAHECIDRIFKYEDVPAAFNELPFVTRVRNFPHANKNNWNYGMGWEDMQSFPAEQSIHAWAEKDFDLFEVTS